MARKIRDPAAVDRIVDAAAVVVASQGIHGASVRAIAAEAGVSTGFITHYFADKQELMERLLTTTNVKAARRVTSAIDAADAPLDKLREAVDALLPLDAQRRREWQVWVAVWGEASQGGELAAGYRAGWAGLREIFAGLLREAQSDGKLGRGLDIDHRAERLVTLLAGIGLLAGVEKPARVRARARQMLAEELEYLGVSLRLAS
jgi:AcrR family transcriptional regulator